ncbi:acyl-CoA dehydrogenase family protein [Puniceibacterium sediminis]|uniref:Acyl-CoA dehydrogenase n=1 Tax=Puniceibacterium sediminis TaxID=1608407 RepID=A0A238V0D3_9RHOB|nr:acyl-CoA dehydrogenase [Puniceibacterium sediminis]SNR27467.1 Acyl-CoA dehydrogenase [Puniceibacterium sediminis]
MNFDLTDERQMLQDGLRRYLRETVTADLLASATGSDIGQSEVLWNGLAEMGVIGALFTEDQGGFGGAGFDLALVFEELGRVGAFEPLLEMGVLAGGLLAELGQEGIVEDIIGGTVRVAFAHAEPASRYDLSHVDATATASGDGWTLTGRKSVVIALPFATHVLISARTGGSTGDTSVISLFLLPVDAVSFRDYPLNGGGRAGELDLDGVSVPKAALIGSEGNAWDALERANARAVTAISAEALGLMESIRTLTTEYLQTRQQFGRPIGKFQALQHRMADVLIEIEQARSAVINLAGHLEADRVTRERHVSATKNLIGRVGRLVVEESIQMHGGIGMTEEYALAHLVKRLTMIDHRFGDTDYHLERFIRLSAA